MNIYNPVQTTPFSIKYKIKARIWLGVNSTIFRWSPFFMRKYRVAILKLFGSNIDWSCSICGSADIVDPWNLSMGKLSSIGKDCYILCHNKVTIGKRCCISRGVDILSASYEVNSSKFELVKAPIIIEDNVWVATRAMVGKGVSIGEGAVVAAMSNVIRDVEPWTVVGGNPAKVIGKREFRK